MSAPDQLALQPGLEPVAAKRRVRPSTAAIAGGVLVVIVLLALLAPVLRPGPNAVSLAEAMEGPSWAHPFGTDDKGRDILARVLAAARIDLVIAVAGSLIAFLVGGTIGLLIGYVGGPVSEGVMRLLDAIQAFPVLVLGLALLAFLGQNVSTIIYAIAFVNTPVFVRLVRAETIAVCGMPYVEAARCVGNPTRRILSRHVLPNVVTAALTQLTTTAGYAILLTGGLSFLGVGVQPPTAEWGAMIQQGLQFLVTGQWWLSVFPGIALVITVLCLQTIGEAFVRGRRVR